MLEVFFWGTLGGLISEFMMFYRARDKNLNKRPALDKFYIITTSIMVLLGGGLAATYSYNGSTLTAILAINIGATAPLILTKMTSANLEIAE